MTANRGSFKKGQSGNPGGRSPRVTPDGKTITELARAHTVEMLNVLKTLAEDKSVEPRDRIVAANSVLARGWGAVKTSTEGDDSPGIADILAELIAKLPA